MKIRWILLLTLAGFALGSCSPVPATSPQATQDLPSTHPKIVPTPTLTPPVTLKVVATIPPESQQETPVMNEVPIPTPLNPSLEKIVNQAKEDLAKRLSIDPGQVEFVEAASVTWPDSSLGCPQPDMLYTQVQVDGMLLRFRVGEQLYEYHSGGERQPFLCK